MCVTCHTVIDSPTIRQSDSPDSPDSPDRPRQSKSSPDRPDSPEISKPSKVWCLGNIEEVAIANSTVDERRAISDHGAAYLLGLDKVYKPDGVFIDDPKGVFILWWYTEVDKNGATLVGYQHKACVGYRLMTNNNDEHFQWTSNVQLISKVYLKMHTNLKWHILNSKDKKDGRNG